MEKYRFNEEKHLHEILIGEKWQSLTGCTTVLSILAKPALIQWAANMAVGYVRENAEREIWPVPEGEEKTFGNYLVSEELLEEARTAHCKRRDKAGDFGTKLHETIEFIIKEAIKDRNGFVKLYVPQEKKSVDNFIKWAVNNKIKFLESEKNIYSERLFLGGIVDFICEIDGQKWIGDIKTAKSGIYPENFAQMAGYQIMLEDMKLHTDIKGYLVLNLKENGEMLEKRSISNEDNKKFFLAALEIYRQQEKLKNNTIK